MRRTTTILAAGAASIAMGIQATPASAHLPFTCSKRQPAQKELRCGKADLYIARSELTFLRKHPSAGSLLSRLAMRIDHLWLRQYAKEHIGNAIKRLLPPHIRGWNCLHSYEASNWHDQDSGHNGHFGGLQLSHGWMGVVGNAAYLTPLEQVWLVEHVAAQHGFDHRWLSGQWSTFGFCSQYF